jgi:glycosyltransferase involved in cell wall biosynthesis
MTKIGLNGSFWGLDTTGSGQYVAHLLRALTSLSLSNDFTLFVPPDREHPEPDAGAPWALCTLPTPLDRRNANLAKLWFEQIAFPRACRRAGIDLAHVPYFAPPLCPALPTVVTIHDLIPLLLPEYRGSRWVQGYMRLVSAAAHRAALVLTDSQASARDIARLLRIPQRRIRVIYLAADSIYHPLVPQECQPVWERLRLPARYLLYLGGFDCRKNVAGLLRAFALTRRQLRDVRLVIAGKLPAEDSAFSPDPRRIARELGLDAAVRFTGWVAEEDKPALYAGAIGFVFPSYYEGFGLPVLEALSCGTPAIVGTGSSLLEIAGLGSLAVSPGDSAALGDALIALTQQPDLRASLAANGLRQAATFSWQKTARLTLDAYREALAFGPVPHKA